MPNEEIVSIPVTVNNDHTRVVGSFRNGVVTTLSSAPNLDEDWGWDLGFTRVEHNTGDGKAELKVLALSMVTHPRSRPYGPTGDGVDRPMEYCSRCGPETPHEQPNVRFYPFKNGPMRDDGGPPITHWGMCPVTGEPVLMWMEEV